MGLIVFWFILISLFWTGFFVLEGFDFGVGMLHGRVGGDEAGRRVAINTIGPLWDGNEVWLIVTAAGMFAAFPGWYATLFSGFYLALVLLLVALILRGVSLAAERGLDRAVRHGTERVEWTQACEGTWRSGHRPGSERGRTRRHAAEFDCHGSGRLRASGDRDSGESARVP